METKPIKVTAAIIEKNRLYLITRRKHGSLAGKWEFPGGKIKPGEDARKCLKREIAEELSIVVEVGSLFGTVRHDYGGGKIIEMSAYLCRQVSGEIKLLDHDDFKWVSPDEMRAYDLADADVPLAEKLKGARQ